MSYSFDSRINVEICNTNHENPKTTSEGKNNAGYNGLNIIPIIDAAIPIIVFMTKFNVFDEILDRARQYGVRIISRRDEEYPPLLRNSETPPSFLYAIGAPLGDRCYVAVVGTREPSPRGSELAYAIGRELAERGYSVVTGGARGVDSQAWEGARSAGGHAVVVAPFLFENGRPWRRIGQNETMVAEALEQGALSGNYWLAMRNRIIVGMAAAVVIPDAKCKVVGGECRKGGWGTRYSAVFGAKIRRPVVVLEPEKGDQERWIAFQHLVNLGALPVKNLDEAMRVVEDEAGDRCVYVKEAMVAV